jgi:hypothetical protein
MKTRWVLGVRYLSRLDSRRWKWLTFNVVRIASCLVALLSLGYLEAKWDSLLLFSEWMDK